MIRIGKVSSVDAKSGMVRVTYPDRDECVSAMLPVFSFTGEYMMPAVGDDVLVAHLSNGSSAGVCLGRYWNSVSPPPVSDGFYKSLGDGAYIKFAGGELTIRANKITLDGEVSATSDIDASGISLKNHTHMGVHGETGSARG